jgi:hypothetical protein
MRKYLVAVIPLLFIACTEPTSTSNGLRAGDLKVRSVLAATAPSAVLPSGYTGIMGAVNNNFPQASFRQMRYQQVFLGSDVVNPEIVSLCMRRDEVVGSIARTKTLTIKLGPTSQDYTSIGATFDDNYSAPPTTVFSGDVIIPASLGDGTPADFDFCIPFTQAYEHPAGSNLIVEVINTSLDLRDAPRDACDAGESQCTTGRAYAFSPTATTATTVGQGGVIMKLVSPEPPAPVDPVSHDDCYKGGWSDFNFKNQGQCVRFVETGKDSRIGQ